MTRSIVLLLLAGCGERVLLSIPAPRTSGTEILLIGDAVPRASFALDLADESPLEFTVMPKVDRRIEAWISDLSPARLGLKPGEIEIDEGLTATELGLAFEVFTATIAGRTIRDWDESDSSWSALVRFASASGCLPNGCFDETGIACLTPCPTPPDPMPPIPAEVPTASCAPGWQTVTLKGGVSACTPWVGEVPECIGSDTIFPGEASCHPLGPGCPAGDFPSDVPQGLRIYVLEGAGDGDGTQSSPLGSIQRAIDLSADGQVIVVGAGTYREALNVHVPVIIVGACPERTTIDASAGPAVRLLALSSSIHNLTIRSSDIGVEVGASASFVLEDTIIDGTAGTGLSMPTTALGELRRVVFRDTGGPALSMESGAVLTGDRVHIHGAGMGAINVEGGELTLVESVVRDSLPARVPPFGSGAFVRNGALVLTRTLFSGNAESGVATFDSSVEVDQTVIRRTDLGLNNVATDGVGLLISNVVGRTMVRNTWLDANRSANLRVQNTVLPTAIEDTVMSNARKRSDGDPESGVNLSLVDAFVSAERIAALDADATAIKVTGRGVDLFDVTVIGAGLALAGQGDGITFENATELEGRLMKVRIEDIAGQSIRLISTEKEQTVSVEDAFIARAGGGDCLHCSGLCAYRNTTAVANRVRIETARGSAVIARSGSQIEASDLSIEGTLPAADCRGGSNSDGLAGVGLRVDGATMRASRFLIRNNAESGVDLLDILSTGSSLDLIVGALEDNPVGANVFVEGYDVRRLATFVRYRRNATTFNFGSE
jgi:hypothetical protein